MRKSLHLSFLLLLLGAFGLSRPGLLPAQINGSARDGVRDALSGLNEAAGEEDDDEDDGEYDDAAADRGDETGVDGDASDEDEDDDEVSDDEDGGQAPGSGKRLLQKGIGALSNLLGGEEGEDALGLGTTDDGEHQSKIAELKRNARQNFEKNRVDESIKNINELITLKPYEAEYHFALGLCFRQEGKYREALKKYQDVLDLGGPKALIALLKAEVFAAENKKEKVFELLKEAAIGGRNIINDVQNLALLSKFSDDTEFIQLALQLEVYELGRERRDPFTNPFPKLIKGTADGPRRTSAEDPRVLSKTQQEKLLREAKKLYERIQFYIKLQDEDKAMAAYLQLKDVNSKQSLITVPRILTEFKMLQDRMSDIEIEISGIRLRYYYNKAQEQLKRMREIFKDGEYARVQNVHAELEALTKEMSATNERYKEVADTVLERSRYWLGRAQVRLEFQSRKPEIQGIIISGNSKFTILNDRVVKQGEGLDDFRVVKVESNKVTFRFKGEEIPMVFRRY